MCPGTTTVMRQLWAAALEGGSVLERVGDMVLRSLLLPPGMPVVIEAITLAMF